MSDNGSKMKNNESSNNFRTAHSTKHFQEQEEPPRGPKNLKHSTQKEWPDVFQRQLKHMAKFNFLDLRKRFCIPSLYLPR